MTNELWNVNFFVNMEQNIRTKFYRKKDAYIATKQTENSTFREQILKTPSSKAISNTIPKKA